jgi:uncharacterized coiled-coil protein SlyX
MLAAQQQLHRIEQWKMADLQRRLGDLEVSQLELISALNDTNALHGLFIDTMARRLSSLAEEAERVAREKNAQSLKLTDHAARVRIAERLAEAIALDVQREDERKELLDIVEQVLNRKGTSLP